MSFDQLQYFKCLFIVISKIDFDIFNQIMNKETIKNFNSSKITLDSIYISGYQIGPHQYNVVSCDRRTAPLKAA